MLLGHRMHLNDPTLSVVEVSQVRGSSQTNDMSSLLSVKQSERNVQLRHVLQERSKALG